MLKIENVTKKLGTQVVLDNCSLEIKDGSVFGLIGPNGAGKSTLLRCIAVSYTHLDVYKRQASSFIMILGGTWQLKIRPQIVLTASVRSR